MLLKFKLHGVCYWVLLTNGMTIDQLIDRLIKTGAPIQPIVQRNLDERNGWCGSVISQVRDAKLDSQWLTIVNACVHGTATLAE